MQDQIPDTTPACSPIQFVPDYYNFIPDHVLYRRIMDRILKEYKEEIGDVQC